jgi:hypothetical protein
VNRGKKADKKGAAVSGSITRSLALLLLGALVVTGCGFTDTSSSTTTRGIDTSLTILVNDSGTARSWYLTCDPDDSSILSTLPDPESACAVLRDHGDQIFAPVATDRICAQVYGDDRTAQIFGDWWGNHVDVTITRTDSCQIARWDALLGPLPAVPD